MVVSITFEIILTFLNIKFGFHKIELGSRAAIGQIVEWTSIALLLYRITIWNLVFIIDSFNDLIFGFE